jgi:glutamyl-tRNA synthetase
MASAPHGGEIRYPASLRPTHLEPGWYENLHGDAALRFRVEEGTVSFVDRVYGTVTESVAETVGDFVLKRRDGLYAYQLAVVVDDLAMGITEVVRGADLLVSTARQIQLIAALGGSAPVYAHVPLVLSASGEKLSKRDQPMALRSLRDEGVAPETVVGRLAQSLGLLDRMEACRPGELVALFDWAKIHRGEWLSYKSPGWLGSDS